MRVCVCIPLSLRGKCRMCTTADSDDRILEKEGKAGTNGKRFAEFKAIVHEYYFKLKTTNSIYTTLLQFCASSGLALSPNTIQLHVLQ